MSYTKIQSKQAFERVRQLILSAPGTRITVQTVIDDTTLGTIIADEDERKGFVISRNRKEWFLTEDPKFCGAFTFAGTCAGDGYINLAFGEDIVTFAPTTGDDVDAIATQAVSTINTQSTEWTATVVGSGAIKVCPLAAQESRAVFSATSSDTGVTVTSRSPFQAPLDVQLGGDVLLLNEQVTFPGTSSRA